MKIFQTAFLILAVALGTVDAQWVYGEKGASCTDACSQQSLSCGASNEQRMGEVDTQVDIMYVVYDIFGVPVSEFDTYESGGTDSYVFPATRSDIGLFFNPLDCVPPTCGANETDSRRVCCCGDDTSACPLAPRIPPKDPGWTLSLPGDSCAKTCGGVNGCSTDNEYIMSQFNNPTTAQFVADTLQLGNVTLEDDDCCTDLPSFRNLTDQQKDCRVEYSTQPNFTPSCRGAEPRFMRFCCCSANPFVDCLLFPGGENQPQFTPPTFVPNPGSCDSATPPTTSAPTKCESPAPKAGKASKGTKAPKGSKAPKASGTTKASKSKAAKAPKAYCVDSSKSAKSPTSKSSKSKAPKAFKSKAPKAYKSKPPAHVPSKK